MQNTVDEQQKIINRFGDMQREAQEAFLSELKRREEQQKQDRRVENEGMRRQFLSELAKVKVRGVPRCV
jgi:predicted nucleic acid-binding protein